MQTGQRKPCGCSKSNVRVTPRNELVERAAMCLACPQHVESEGGRVAPCPAGQAGACPGGMWPDKDGMVRWPAITIEGRTLRGPRWRGVPDPVRWEVAARARRHGARPPAYWGCGCIHRLKAAWERAVSAIRRTA